MNWLQSTPNIILLCSSISFAADEIKIENAKNNKADATKEIELCALSLAVKNNSLQDIKKLLQEGADPLQEGPNGDVWNEVTQLSIARLLLDYNNQPENYESAFAGLCQSMQSWEENERKDFLLMLLNKKVNPNKPLPVKGMKENTATSSRFLPLHKFVLQAVIFENDITREIEILLEYGADPEVPDPSGLTAYDLTNHNKELKNLLKTKREKYIETQKKLNEALSHKESSLYTMPKEKKKEIAAFVNASNP